MASVNKASLSREKLDLSRKLKMQEDGKAIQIQSSRFFKYYNVLTDRKVIEFNARIEELSDRIRIINEQLDQAPTKPKRNTPQGANFQEEQELEKQYQQTPAYKQELDAAQESRQSQRALQEQAKNTEKRLQLKQQHDLQLEKNKLKWLEETPDRLEKKRRKIAKDILEESGIPFGEGMYANMLHLNKVLLEEANAPKASLAPLEESPLASLEASLTMHRSRPPSLEASLEAERLSDLLGRPVSVDLSRSNWTPQQLSRMSMKKSSGGKNRTKKIKRKKTRKQKNKI